MFVGLLAVTVLSGLHQKDPFDVLHDPNQFPIAVWLQDPSNAGKYQAAGFNVYIGLWQGPTEDQLNALKKAKMPVICEMNQVGKDHKADPTIVGWMHGDEPDNAQPITDPKTGQSGYGPCIPPERIVADYRKMKAADPTRPIILNLGQGVANDEWIGRGNGSSLKDYETYIHGGDIVSFDIYPIAGLSKPNPEDYLWYVPKGLDRLSEWMKGKGRRWNCIECTRIDGNRKATPEQVCSEVWMSIIHGTSGLIYFVHQFKPTFDEHALLDDPEMLKSVADQNHQIQELAPILNSPTVNSGYELHTANLDCPVDSMAKRVGNQLYLFTVGMRNRPEEVTIRLTGERKGKSVTVINESRHIAIHNGTFSDSFTPYQPHIYRIDL